MDRRIACLFAAACLVAMPRLARADSIEERIDAACQRLGSPDSAKAVEQLETIATELKETIQSHPDDPASHYHLGRVSFYLDRDREAATEFDTAIKLAPEKADGHFMRGVVARFMQDAKQAEASLRRAAELDPKRPDIWAEYGEVLVEQDNADAAADAFEKALTLEPQNAKALNGMIDVDLTAHRFKKALPLLEKLVKLTPDDFLAHYNLGQTYQNLKRFDKSLAAFRKALAIDGNDWRTHAKVIQNLESLGKTKERDAARDTLLKLWKKDPEQIDSEFYCRDQFEVDDKKVMVFEYFAFEGERRVRYSFSVSSKKTGKHLYRVSLGSYDATHEHAVARGLVKGDQRYCHLDRYSPDGTHETFGFFVGEPTYDKTKTLVLKVLKHEIEPQSSMTPTP